jgi:hypothetical protein
VSFADPKIAPHSILPFARQNLSFLPSFPPPSLPSFPLGLASVGSALTTQSPFSFSRPGRRWRRRVSPLRLCSSSCSAPSSSPPLYLHPSAGRENHPAPPPATPKAAPPPWPGALPRGWRRIFGARMRRSPCVTHIL